MSGSVEPSRRAAGLAAYKLADLSAPGCITPVSLAQNESLRPPGPAAIAAGAELLCAGHLYPDPDWANLRNALAAHHGIAARSILCGAGSLELIAALAGAYADEDNAVLTPTHAYPFFGTAAAMAGARRDCAAETDLTADPEAILAAVRPDTRIVCLANPGNPTGTRLPNVEIRALRAALPMQILLVLDEAYGEFADHLEAPPFDLVAEGGTVLLRTFSKAYGLAGARVGWGAFPEGVAAEARKFLNPNNISNVSQAMAQAALREDTYMRATVAETARLRDDFSERLRQAGLHPVTSLTNFVLVPLPGVTEARAVEAGLRSEGVLVRRQAGAGLPHALRVTVGAALALERAADLFVATLEGMSR